MVQLKDTSVYEFETEALIGAIRAGHALPHHGLIRLRHKATGVEFVHPQWSMLNIFRIMGVVPGRAGGLGQSLGEPRNEEHSVEIGDGALTLRWRPNRERQVEVALGFAVGEPDHIDTTVTIRAEAAYGGFEVLLSSYNNPALVPHAFLARDKFELADVPGRFKDEPELVAVTVNDAIRGGVVIFPRDPAGARIYADGRWDPVARFSPVRRYKLPLLFHTDAARRVAAVWMTRPETCFAVGAGYDSPDPDDRFKRNNPSYLSLFGEDLKPGDERTASARLIVTELDGEMTQPLELYRKYAGP